MRWINRKMSMALLAMGLTHVIWAAEAPAGSETSPAAPQVPAAPQAAETPAKPQNGAAGTPTPDRFEPTERISEDLSVAFPVDI